MLSVASQCPACSGALTSTFLGLEHEGELAECRSCGRPVRSRTSVCPHCGIPSPARRRAHARVILPVVVTILLSLMAVSLRNRALLPSRADSTAAATTPAAPQPVMARGVVAAPPKPQAESAGADTAAGPTTTLPQVTAAMDSAALLAAGLKRKWTTDWSNMHRAPRNESPVIRVLPPGTEVHVAENQWGWWAILWKGDTVGYIAGALLRSTRPYRTP